MRRDQRVENGLCRHCGATPTPGFRTCADFRERSRLKAARWREENRARLRTNDRRREYGLTDAQWDEMFQAQGGCCAICFDSLEKPHIDHDHEHGFVRGLLCSRCNHGLGLFRDDPRHLLSAVEYLTQSRHDLLVFVPKKVAA